jgi:hypothetical protein
MPSPRADPGSMRVTAIAPPRHSMHGPRTFGVLA